jgi:hypothetical protein
LPSVALAQRWGLYIYSSLQGVRYILLSLKAFIPHLNWLERRSVYRYTTPFHSPELGAEHRTMDSAKLCLTWNVFRSMN